MATIVAMALLDVRPCAQFIAGHAPGAVNIPLEELSARVHELPAKSSTLRVSDTDPTRLSAAVAALEMRGFSVERSLLDARELTERGTSTARLWQPTPFLVECIEFIRERGRAVDLACGTGRDGLYLALQGFDVTAIDILPDALERAADLAARNAVRLNTVCRDLSADPHLPAGQHQLVTMFRFVDRGLFPAIRGALAAGGHLVIETFHEKTRTTGRPPRKRDHVVRTGELAAAFDGMEIVIARDAVERDGRYFSQLFARAR